ncbi:MAG: type VII secretion integral membrane protein EccD, partial [Streptomycetaceae bacterium]|nr:type VII secretion integral membrane protein EccD [Streptomycetaceae bacterium]
MNMAVISRDGKMSRGLPRRCWAGRVAPIHSEIVTEALGEPQWCRVSVVGGNTQVDLALPAAVPIASYIGELTGLVESRNPDRGEDDDAEATRLEHWSLARLGGSPFAPEQTLAALGVLDGDLLVLQKVSGSTVPALFDDVIDAVARLSADMFDSWGAAAARRTGLAVTAVAVGAAMALLVALKQQQGRVVLAGLVAAGFGVVAFAAALYAARSRADAASTVVFGLCAALLPAFGFAVALPDGLGSPHAMLACAVAAVLGVLVHRYTGVGAAAFSALVTLGLFGAGAAVARLASDAAGTKIGAGVVAVGLTFMT